MYKKQMTLQRIVCYFLLIASALVFIYSLGLVTDLYDNNFRLYAENYESPMVAGTQVYYDIQEFNRELTKMGIVLILLAVSQFVFQNHNRRKYYIANYITVAANTVAGVLVAKWAVDAILTYKEQYLQVDFEALKMWSQMLSSGFYTESTFWFDISTYVFAILLIANLFNVLNLIFKIVVMSGEKKLIKEGKGA